MYRNTYMKNRVLKVQVLVKTLFYIHFKNPSTYINTQVFIHAVLSFASGLAIHMFRLRRNQAVVADCGGADIPGDDENFMTYLHRTIGNSRITRKAMNRSK